MMAERFQFVGVNLIWASKFEFAGLPVYDGVPVGVSAPCALWMADAVVTRRHLATGVGSFFTILLSNMSREVVE